MFHSKVHIEAGDLVIVFLSRDSMLAINVTPGQTMNNKYGRYQHDDMIGMKYGSKMISPLPHSGFVHLLRPTPELWTLSLPHRTQILYNPDISFITAKLGVRPGGRVVEAGTGSGSMTHALARSVGPRGRVHTYEYHQPRYEKAKIEFESHGLSNVVPQHRNVCKDGFGDVQNVEAVFLDLPAPWEAVPHAVKILRHDMITKICCFSPCLEQVLKTVTSLRKEGFSDVSTHEVLVRTHELAPQSGPKAAPPLSTISETIERLRLHDKKKAERRRIQMKTAREKVNQKRAQEAAQEAAEKETTSKQEIASSSASIAHEGTSKLNADAPSETQGESSRKRPHQEQNGDQASKRVRVEREENAGEARSQVVATGKGNDETLLVEKGNLEKRNGDDENVNANEDGLMDEKDDAYKSIWTEPVPHDPSPMFTKPSAEARGHTSYLTFACLYPADIRAELAKRDGTQSQLEQVQISNRKLQNGEEDTEYGSDGIDEVMGTLTEEEMMSMSMSKSQPDSR